jgi:hypothetical protein
LQLPALRLRIPFGSYGGHQKLLSWMSTRRRLLIATLGGLPALLQAGLGLKLPFVPCALPPNLGVS